MVEGIHKGKVYVVGSRNDVIRFQSGLEGIGSSHQVETLEGVQIIVMSTQIAQHTRHWQRVGADKSSLTIKYE